MPVYVYKCPVCQQVKEVLQRLTDPAPHCRHVFPDGNQVKTPGCSMEKQLTAPGFAINGEGVYSPGTKASK